MTEQALSEPEPEVLSEPLHASPEEFFATGEEIQIGVEKAIDEGIIEVHPVDSFVNTFDMAVYVPLEISRDDLEPSSPALHSDNRYRYAHPASDVIFKDPEKIHSVEAQKVKEKILIQASEKYDRFWHEPFLTSQFEDGSEVNQYAEVRVGEHSIPIINFTDRLATADEMEDMRRAIETMSNLTGGKIMEETSAIIIQDPESFDPNTAGSTRGHSRVVRLSTVCLDEPEDIPHPLEYRETINESMLHTTVIHELGHIVDLSGKQRKVGADDLQPFVFSKAVGWQKNGNNASGTEGSNAGNVGDAEQYDEKRGSFIAPVKTTVFHEGQFVEVDTLDHFGSEAGNESPVSWYGKESDLEDLAETMVPYAIDRKQVPALRQNAVSNLLHINSGGEYGPQQAKLTIMDRPERKIGLDITSQKADVLVTYNFGSS